MWIRDNLFRIRIPLVNQASELFEFESLDSDPGFLVKPVLSLVFTISVLNLVGYAAGKTLAIQALRRLNSELKRWLQILVFGDQK